MYIAKKIASGTFEKRSIVRSKIAYAKAFAKRGFDKKVILCYPQKPRVWHMLYQITHALGLKISNDPHKPFDVGIVFWDTTRRAEDPELAELEKHHMLINARCGDISKARVEDIFQKVFGYGMAVDPRNFDCPYVRKSNTNAAHDGKILNGPTEPEEDVIYQRLINNTRGNENTFDIRTFIIKDVIPFTIFRYKSIHDRFNITIHAEPVDPDEAYSKDEQAKILQFCKEFGLDYGELDILRDADDGKIYIVDVNNTPSGPERGIHLPKDVYDTFLEKLSRAFETAFVKNI